MVKEIRFGLRSRTWKPKAEDVRSEERWLTRTEGVGMTSRVRLCRGEPDAWSIPTDFSKEREQKTPLIGGFEKEPLPPQNLQFLPAT